MSLLKFSKINLTKISLLPLIISNRLRLCWLLNLRILNLIQYFFKVTFWNEKTLEFIFSLNLRMLRWTVYFLIIVKTRSATSFVSTGNSFFLVIFIVFPLLTKYEQPILCQISFIVIFYCHFISSNCIVWEILFEYPQEIFVVSNAIKIQRSSLVVFY